MMASQSFEPYLLLKPAADPIPLVCDSPHSGVHYPADFRAAIAPALLRKGEDTDVHVLWGAAPALGATLLAANFPRVYIDPNRTLDDLDPELLDGPWPLPLQPGPKTRLGFGLIWRNIEAGVPIYDRKLSVAEVQDRINRCYKPYHAALADAIDDSVRRFGRVWHLNLHSMPNNAYQRLKIDSPHPLADFVLGDRDGTTCDPAFVDLVATALRSRGYTVRCNDPYKGVQLIAQIGQPHLQRHSLQIELRRPLYMDEATRSPNAVFSTVQRDLSFVLEQVAEYIRAA